MPLWVIHCSWYAAWLQPFLQQAVSGAMRQLSQGVSDVACCREGGVSETESDPNGGFLLKVRLNPIPKTEVCKEYIKSRLNPIPFH